MTLRQSQDFFDPPLWMQRRVIIQEIIQDTKCASVLDIGCGEGSLLQYLSNWNEEDIHNGHIDIVRLTGIDILPKQLDIAQETSRPAQGSDIRGSPLDIDLYEGNISSLVNCRPNVHFNAIVLAEVIEHLSPPLIHQPYHQDISKRHESCIPALLRNFQPHILIITTPNKDFNIHFQGPMLSHETCPYPVRHDEHSFEFTSQEFREWCEKQTEGSNYDVSFRAIGREDLCKDGATQLAIFTHRHYVVRAVQPYQELSIPGIIKHAHISHPWEKLEISHDNIIDALNAFMPYLPSNKMRSKSKMISTSGTIDELFQISYKLRRACAGDKNAIVEAINATSGNEDGIMKIAQIKGQQGVIWLGYLPRPTDQDSDFETFVESDQDETDYADEERDIQEEQTAPQVAEYDQHELWTSEAW